MRKSFVPIAYMLCLSLVAGVMVLTALPAASGIEAEAVDIHPKTLNLKSNGTWITAYIEPPEGYNVSDIDVTTILLEGSVPAETDPKYGFVKNPEIKDRDGDGIPELMVKFERQAINCILSKLYHYAPPPAKNYVELTITGKLLDGTPFEGKDTIRVVYKG